MTKLVGQESEACSWFSGRGQDGSKGTQPPGKVEQSRGLSFGYLFQKTRISVLSFSKIWTLSLHEKKKQGHSEF